MTWMYWLIFAFLALGLEAALSGMILVFFALGALISAALSPWISSEMEWLCFSLSSIVLLIVFRTRLRSTLSQPKAPAVEDDFMHSLVGKTGIITQSIHPPAPGRVEINGSTWTARAQDHIALGSLVRITHTEHMDLWVQEENS